MLIDSLLEMSDAQAFTTVTTHASTDVIDLKVAGDVLANELFLVVTVNTAITSDGAATVQFDLQTSAVENFASSTTLWSSGAIAKANLTAGKVVARLRLPTGCLRYLRMAYTVGTAALTAGAVSAALVPASNLDHTVQ